MINTSFKMVIWKKSYKEWITKGNKTSSINKKKGSLSPKRISKIKVLIFSVEKKIAPGVECNYNNKCLNNAVEVG